jgi:hypothetical protein
MSVHCWVPTALALLAGLSNGSYPLFLKTAAVLAADVHAVVFQSFKSSTLLLLGALLVCGRLVAGKQGYSFTWWGVAVAAAWIPSGLTTIAAVPRIGMAPTMLTAAGTGTVISFFVGWLALGESLKLHPTASGGAYVPTWPASWSGWLASSLRRTPCRPAACRRGLDHLTRAPPHRCCTQGTYPRAGRSSPRRSRRAACLRPGPPFLGAASPLSPGTHWPPPRAPSPLHST